MATPRLSKLLEEDETGLLAASSPPNSSPAHGTGEDFCIFPDV